jgi:ecotin
MKKKIFLLILFIISLLIASVIGGFLTLSFAKKLYRDEIKSYILPSPKPTVEDTTKISDEEIKMFPLPKKDMKRFVFKVPKLSNLVEESEREVEIIVGKNMLGDCNHLSIGSTINKKVLEGWGANYYEVLPYKGIMSTLMGCFDTPQTEQFVRLHGDHFFIRYSSESPIVVYVPDDLEVRYQIWKEEENTFKVVER